MKKYILPLILILFLTFTLIGNCDWLAGWDYRIEISLPDYAGDIGGSVTWFPVTVFLTATQGEEVFVELTTDAEYLKVAFTEADGTTQLYGECELFDFSEELGIYHVSRDGWTINANTSIYMYYDKDHADNTTYIGAIGARTEVWNDQYRMVQHKVDTTTSTITDSTSNNNDGTKKAANEPVETTGKVGQAQNYDGDNDIILVSHSGSLADISNLTIEVVVYPHSWIATYSYYCDKSAIAGDWLLSHGTTEGKELFRHEFSTQYGAWFCPSLTLNDWSYLAVTYNNSAIGNNPIMYIDSVAQALDENLEPIGTAKYSTGSVGIGNRSDEPEDRQYDGLIDEIRISNTIRSAAWLKGTYNSLWDTLFTYGSEEEVAPWLSSWGKRIEIRIGDYAGDIGGAVTWFPVEVFLTAAQCEEVFVELTSDAEYKKIQFTESDGTSLLYGHMKLFDVSETLGIFTVSADGWVINANTSIFLYYDAGHADNNTYIGVTNTAACEAVYNAEYKAVYTMADGVDNAHIYDATSNDNDGTKSAPDEPNEVTGIVGKGQNFDGNDYINIGTNIPSLELTTFTISACINPTTSTSDKVIYYIGDLTGDRTGWGIVIKKSDDGTNPNKFYLESSDGGGGRNLIAGQAVTYNAEHVAATFASAGQEVRIYQGGALITDDDGTLIVPDFTGDNLVDIGAIEYSTGGYAAYFLGIIDELRISNVVRTAEWQKGEYNSLWDSLLSYRSEEEAPAVAEVNVIFFSTPF